MNRVPVQSSNVVSVGHDGETLEIEFAGKDGKPGAIYRYANVSPAIFRACLAARSVGSFIAQNIKGKFDCVKVEKR